MLIAAGIIAVEVPSLRNRKLKKEMLAFFVLLMVGLGMNIAQTLNAPIPSPLDWIIIIFKPFTGWIAGL
ncbi:hypothetical protein E2980_19100 [Cohnella luojiensis]|uniref:Uncharacterized protein n=2 Tax=Cohnella luojiensis TaxID=652876 RepID=A0A4Y8LRN5_9BACL|nr:hypothetical protein E2980_19100 [Cohnella luojiensis]